ncbi:MAG: hypothetical protein AAB463_01620 [Patescibacteria group bacterium]
MARSIQYILSKKLHTYARHMKDEAAVSALLQEIYKQESPMLEKRVQCSLDAETRHIILTVPQSVYAQELTLLLPKIQYELERLSFSGYRVSIRVSQNIL